MERWLSFSYNLFGKCYKDTVVAYERGVLPREREQAIGLEAGVGERSFLGAFPQLHLEVRTKRRGMPCRTPESHQPVLQQV